MNPESLEPLLEKLCQGDMAAARQVFLAYEPYLRRVVRRQLPQRLRPKLDSADIVQSIWADLLEGYRAGDWHFPDLCRFEAFLVQVTHHRFIDRIRKHRLALEREQPLANVPSDVLPVSSEPQPVATVEAAELWQRMLDLCPPEHQELLRLKRQGLPMEELAARTGLHPGSIRRIFRNLARRLALEEPTVRITTDRDA